MVTGAVRPQLGLLPRTTGSYQAVLPPPAPSLGAESGSGKLLVQSTPLFISNKRLLVLLSSYATFKNSKLSPLSEPFTCKNPPVWLSLHIDTSSYTCSGAPPGDSVRFDLCTVLLFSDF